MGFLAPGSGLVPFCAASSGSSSHPHETPLCSVFQDPFNTATFREECWLSWDSLGQPALVLEWEFLLRDPNRAEATGFGLGHECHAAKLYLWGRGSPPVPSPRDYRALRWRVAQTYLWLGPGLSSACLPHTHGQDDSSCNGQSPTAFSPPS